MIEKAQFSTCPETSRRGLLICGMNWGGKPRTTDEGEAVSQPWSPLFSHPENASRGFQSSLLTWFDLWGYPLSHQTPTLLDRAIAQSNVFFDQSARFLSRPKRERWTIGINRLADAINILDFSGVLVVSSMVADWIVWLSARGEIPAWQKTMGDIRWDTPMHRRLNLRFGRGGHRLAAAVAHHASGVAHDDVKDAKSEMKEWINAVIIQYRRKTEQSPPPYSSPAASSESGEE